MAHVSAYLLTPIKAAPLEIMRLVNVYGCAFALIAVGVLLRA
jgi:hypothetical protein